MSRWDRIRGLTKGQRTLLLSLFEAEQTGASAGGVGGFCRLSMAVVYRAFR